MPEIQIHDLDDAVSRTAPGFGRVSKKIGAHPKAAPKENPLKHDTEAPPKVQSLRPFDLSRTGTEVMTITPELAQMILSEWNDRNRPIRLKRVQEYAAAMSAGRWAYTGVPIIFSGQRLLDGQNRLQACVKAGVPFDALVVFGAPDDSFAFIDTGASRSAADVFAINKVTNYTLIAAALPLVIGYETHSLGSAFSASTLDHDQLYGAYLERVDIQGSAWVADVFKRLAPASIMVAFHYLCAKKSRALADEFFRQTGDGVGLESNKTPAYKLRESLILNSSAPEKLPRKSIAAITVKAWNATRMKRSAGKLVFAVDEPFPRII